ncbi:hypothetical protein M3Y95_00621000 [Aphelenchoides besseyi]|nr:hypothetical protein M3Y95_00621000 [Aphelenchoides besseyi]
MPEQALLNNISDRITALLVLMIILGCLIVIYTIIECGLVVYSMSVHAKKNKEDVKSQLESVVVDPSSKKRRRKSNKKSSRKKRKSRRPSVTSTKSKSSKSSSKKSKQRSAKSKKPSTEKKSDRWIRNDARDVHKPIPTVPNTPAPSQEALKVQPSIQRAQEAELDAGCNTAEEISPDKLKKISSLLNVGQPHKPELNALTEVSAPFKPVQTGKEKSPSVSDARTAKNGMPSDLKTAVEKPSEGPKTSDLKTAVEKPSEGPKASGSKSAANSAYLMPSGGGGARSVHIQLPMDNQEPPKP